MTPLISSKLIGYTDEGGHWYKKRDGTVVYISKAVTRKDEDVHIRPEHGMPGYDPIWEYNWYRLGEEIEQRAWFESLTDEQREELKGRVGQA